MKIMSIMLPCHEFQSKCMTRRKFQKIFKETLPLAFNFLIIETNTIVHHKSKIRKLDRSKVLKATKDKYQAKHHMK